MVDVGQGEGGNLKAVGYPTSPGLRQLSAAVLSEQPLTPDTSVTSSSQDHLERSIPFFVLRWPRRARTQFHPELRNPHALSADAVRASDLQRRAGTGIVRQGV